MYSADQHSKAIGAMIKKRGVKKGTESDRAMDSTDPGQGYGAGAHPGFAAVQKHIEGEGYTKDQAGAILASKTRGASAAAKKKNPALKNVKG